MIELTHFNGQLFLLNPFLIEQVEALPDTTITLVSGKKIVVKERPDQVGEAVRRLLKEIGFWGGAQAEQGAVRCLKAD
ncbi:MAG: flagellar FlbD family protein [Sporolactobacillus sp.]